MNLRPGVSRIHLHLIRVCLLVELAAGGGGDSGVELRGPDLLADFNPQMIMETQNQTRR